MAILQTTGITGSLSISSSGLTTGSVLLSVDGLAGRLFAIDDNLSGSLFSVNTIAGLPIIEAFSDNTVNIGKYNAEAIRVVDSGQSVTFGSGSKMYVSSSGNVGIGTTNPIRRLQIGNLTSTSTANPETLSLGGTWSNTAGSNIKLRVFEDSSTVGGMSVSGGQIEVNTWTAGKIAFYRGTTQSAIIDASGSLGVGTSIPAGKIHVRDDSTNPTLILEDRGTNSDPFILFIPTSSVMSFAMGIDDSDSDKFKISFSASNAATLGTNDYLTISASGNVGIGTTTPIAKLQVNGNISASSFTSSISNAVGFLGTSSWANNSLTASFLPVGTYNITSSWATNSVTASRANSLNPSNSYTVDGLTANYVEVTGLATIPTTGIYRPATKTLGLSADGTLVFKISNVNLPVTSSIETGNFIVQSGNVGIGSQNPVNKLDVAGNISASVITASLLFGTSSWANNVLTASSLVTTNNYTINNLSANVITASLLRPLSMIELYGLNDAAKGITPTITAGSFNQGGPTYRGYLSYWTVPSSSIVAPFPTMSLDLVSPAGANQFSYVTFGTYFKSDTRFIPYSYRIDTSTDNVSWTNQVAVTTNTSVTPLHALSGEFRYIRLVLLSGQTSASIANGYACQVSAFRVFTERGSYTSDGIWGQSIDGGAVYSAFTNNIGIGTTSPATKLNVSGSTRVSAGELQIEGNDAAIRLYRTTGINYFDWASGQNLYLGTVTSIGGAGRSNKMVILDNGNVGIGTTIPGALLHVEGPSFFNNSISSSNKVIIESNQPGIILRENDQSGTTHRWIDVESGIFRILQTNNDYSSFTTQFAISSSGDVGIGTSSPTALLHSYRNSNTVAPIGYFQEAFGSPAKTNVALFERLNNLSAANVSASSAGVRIREHSTNYALSVEDHSDNSYLVVKGGGNVGIGTSNPLNKLQINGTVSGSSFTSSISNAVGFLGTASWATNALTASSIVGTSNVFIQGGNSFGTTALLGTNDAQSLALETNGSTRMSINSNGNVAINTSTNGIYRLSIVDTHVSSLGSSSLFIQTNQNQVSANSSNDSGINNLYYVNAFTSSTAIQNQAAFNQLYINASGSFSGSYRAERNAINLANTASLHSDGNIINTHCTNQISPNIPTFSIPHWVAGTQTYVDLITGNSTGSITNLYNHYIGSPFPSAGAGGITVNNSYGIYISKQKTTNVVTNGWGIYQDDSNDINYFNGNVGIGTTSATAKLTIGTSTSQSLLVQSNTYNNLSNGVQITTNLGFLNDSTPTLNFARWGGGGWTDHATVGQIFNGASYDLQFSSGRQNTGSAISYFTASAVRMTIQSTTGNVGIGTTNPSYLLDISGSSARINTSNGSGLILGSTRPVTLFNYTSLGITGAQLWVIPPSGGDNISIALGGNFSYNNSVELTYNTVSGDFIIGAQGSSTSVQKSISFWINNTSSVFITGSTSGYSSVGIGTRSPNSFVNSNSTYFTPSASSSFLTLYSKNNDASINLVSSASSDNAIIGGLYFTRERGQSDAHYHIAGIRALQSGTSNTTPGGKLYFYTKIDGAGTETPSPQMSILANGYVGIAAINPGARLHVSASSSTNENIILSKKASGSLVQNHFAARTYDDNASWWLQSDQNSHIEESFYYNGVRYVYFHTYWSSFINPNGYTAAGGLSLGTNNSNHGYGLYIAKPSISGSLNVSGSSIFTGSVTATALAEKSVTFTPLTGSLTGGQSWYRILSGSGLGDYGRVRMNTTMDNSISEIEFYYGVRNFDNLTGSGAFVYINRHSTYNNVFNAVRVIESGPNLESYAVDVLIGNYLNNTTPTPITCLYEGQRLGSVLNTPVTTSVSNTGSYISKTVYAYNAAGANYIGPAYSDGASFAQSQGQVTIGYRGNYYYTTPSALNYSLVVSGSVGIGTNNPTAKLHLSSSSTTNLLYLQSPNATDALFVSSSGRVGIGTTAPTATLTISGSGTIRIGDVYANYNGITLNGSTLDNDYNLLSRATDTTLYINRPTTKDIRFREANADQMILKTGGNLGIGTISPNSKLEVSGSSSNTIFSLKSPTSQDIMFVSGSGRVGIGTNNPDALVTISGSTPLLMTVKCPADASLIQISGSGNIGIGTSAVSTYKLQVNGAFAASTKSFVIDHPTKQGKKLIYGSLESPYHGIRLTGKNTTLNGKCKVELPDYISKLILHDSVNIQLTGIKCNKVLYVDEINVPENYFIIAYEKTMFESYKDYNFFWDFTAIRADVPELLTEM
jgi:hypothetical protein